MSDLRNILKEAEKVRPLAEVNGMKITTYEDGVVLAEEEKMNELVHGKQLNSYPLNADGTPTGSRTSVANVNPNKMFNNRARLVKGEDGKVNAIQVVIDKRAVSDHQRGAEIYKSRVDVYELKRINKKLVCGRPFTVTAEEFVREFDTKLSVNAMLEVMPAIAECQYPVGETELDI